MLPASKEELAPATSNDMAENIADDNVSKIKFVNKRSMSQLREERSKQRLQSQTSLDRSSTWETTTPSTDEVSKVKFVTKRSMSDLSRERSKQKLRTASSTLDLEAPIVEETKAEATLLETTTESPASGSSQSLEEKPVVWQASMPAWRLVPILMCLSVGLFLSLMDTVVLSAALVTISEEFEDWRLAFWAIMSYSLAYAAGGTFFARLGDVCGRQVPVVGSFVAFGAFSIACGFAQNLQQLVAFRALQGLGGSGLYTMAMIVYPELSPPALLPFISMLMGMTISAAGVAGPLIGGAFARNATWRWIFWMNAPICAIPVLLLPWLWPRDKQWAKMGSIRFRQVDFPGLILIIAGSVLLAFTLQQGGNRTYRWTSPIVIAFFILSGVCWLSLISWSKYISRPRLGMIAAQFPWRIMSDRVMISAMGATLSIGFIYIGCLINIPIRTQVVNMKGPVATGVHLLPLMGLCAFGSAFGGAIQGKKNLCSYTLVAASLFSIAGTALLSTLSHTVQVESRQWAGECLLGLGVGMTLSTATILTSLKVQMRDHAIGQALVAQSRTMGGVLGIAVSTIMFNRKIDQNMHPEISEDELYALYSSPAILERLEPSQQQWVSWVYAQSFNDTLRVYMCLAVVALVCSVLTWQKKPTTMAEKKAMLEKAYRDGQVIYN